MSNYRQHQYERHNFDAWGDYEDLSIYLFSYDRWPHGLPISYMLNTINMWDAMWGVE